MKEEEMSLRQVGRKLRGSFTGSSYCKRVRVFIGAPGAWFADRKEEGGEKGGIGTGKGTGQSTRAHVSRLPLSNTTL